METSSIYIALILFKALCEVWGCGGNGEDRDIRSINCHVSVDLVIPALKMSTGLANSVFVALRLELCDSRLAAISFRRRVWEEEPLACSVLGGGSEASQER